MSFKKLALVTAMFAATSGAYAMEAMDDESMAAATGQDGITIGITTNALTLDQRIHDRDGISALAAADAIGGIEDGALITRRHRLKTHLLSRPPAAHRSLPCCSTPCSSPAMPTRCWRRRLPRTWGSNWAVRW